jgi:hypothetical protein
MPTSQAAEILKNSVSLSDVDNSPPGFSHLLQFMLPSPGHVQMALPELPIYGDGQRDYILSNTVLYEGVWASAISIAISKMASLGWRIDDVDKTAVSRIARWQDIFIAANIGQGWVHFISQHLRDYLCTDNGAFIEVVRQTGAPGSKIIGLAHLDSRRCLRTGDIDYPIWYRDAKGAFHKMAAHQVLHISDNPSPHLTFNSKGLCAASRAYDAIRFQAYVDRYRIEKVSGFKPNSLHFLSGINDIQLKKALKAQENEQRAAGGVVYRGAAIIPMIDREGISHVEVPFASLPDGFDYKNELSITHLKYANATGLDIQDLEPLAGQALGTGAQSVVLNNKAKGKGLASWLQAFAHIVNYYVTPEKTTFYFSEKSTEDELKTAQVSTARAQAVGLMTQTGLLTNPQGNNILADLGEIPEAFRMAPDATPVVSATDSDKLDLTVMPALENQDLAQPGAVETGTTTVTTMESKSPWSQVSMKYWLPVLENNPDMTLAQALQAMALTPESFKQALEKVQNEN